ncbi:MAG: transporter [Bacteroidetes bacterium GWF2_43_63]|nr:MAG: transporter [Bacteroidetes bacterium GWE2_42_42]OFY54869.1 MAG: transporter [Bacteroidetes bacterium GWF2_43_63]HCB63227.1 transporter [Bacteroidales bacterium]HCY22168.1 transporter [Bacteroidales bacterium]
MSTRLLLLLLLIASIPATSHAQLTLEQCYEKARNNYPLVSQYGLIEKSEAYNLSNAAKAWLPQLSFSAKATWQSEVIELPFTMPGVGEMDHDQYQATLELSQTVWDGGATGARREMYKASSELEKQKYEVDLYTIKERVNQLYFGILLLNEQLNLNAVLLKDLETNYNRVEASMNNGMASQADLDAVRVEQLKAGQMKAELLASEKSFIEMLSAFTGENISIETVFVKPDASLISQETNSILRPEVQLFDAQSNLFASQQKMVRAGTMPKLGLFAQGGYGKPGLNMLSNELNPFFIGGVRLSWNISGFYTQSNEIQLLKINQRGADIQKQTFLFNTNMKIAQQRNEIAKFQELLKSDDEIIRLRQGIQHTTEVRVENGTATASDLIRDLNAVNRSMLDKAMHEMQMLSAMYNLKNSTNQ